MKKAIVVFSIILLSGCAQMSVVTPPTGPVAKKMRIEYQVSARKDPFLGPISGPKSYAINPNENAEDAIIDKNILFIISQELEKLGWQKTSLSDAEYVFSVVYRMEAEKITRSGSIPVTTTTYDWQRGGKSKQHVTQQSYSRTEDVYNRGITITVTSKDGGDIWSSECTSKGSTRDILFVAKGVIPFAISKFPNEGYWDRFDELVP